MTGDMWAAQAEHFADRCRVILVDPPGHGGSQKLTSMFDFADCARCIVDILDALDEKRTHFVGNSWGGMIGGTFAAMHPDRIGRAVLMNCTASAAGARQKLEYAALLSMAKLLGGVRPPLTRAVLRRSSARPRSPPAAASSTTCATPCPRSTSHRLPSR